MSIDTEYREALRTLRCDTSEDFVKAQQALALHRLADAMERIATSMEVNPQAVAMGTAIQMAGKVMDMVPDGAVGKVMDMMPDMPDTDDVKKKGSLIGRQFVGKMKEIKDKL